MAGDPFWISLGLAALLSAILSMDDVSLAQTWFGQPLPAGVLAGFMLGDPVIGLAVGLPLQLVLLGNLPVGRTFTGESTSAAIAVVSGMIISGHSLMPVDLGLAGLRMDLLGWLLLGAVLLSLIGNVIVSAERSSHAYWMLEGGRSLRDGSLQRVDRIQARCLFATFLRGLILGGLFTVAIIRLWLPLFPDLPERVHQGLGFLPLLAPGLGIGIMIDHYGPAVSWRWILAGGLAAFVVVQVVL